MIYRIGTYKDHADIEDCIASTEYYPDVDAGQLGGTFVVAELEGQIIGCIWAFHHKCNAYVDYLAIRPGYQAAGFGTTLSLQMRKTLKRRGVRYVRTCVHISNIIALHQAEELGVNFHLPYALGFTDIGAK